MGIYIQRGYDLASAKNACGLEIESWYSGVALDVFDSSALGSSYRYYCSEADQLRMVNGRVANTSVTLVCGPVPTEVGVDPVYTWRLHTSTEAGKVHTDYVQFTKDIAITYQGYKDQLAAATTVEQVEVVFYAMNPSV